MALKLKCPACGGDVAYEREVIPGLAAEAQGNEKVVYLECDNCGKWSRYKIKLESGQVDEPLEGTTAVEGTVTDGTTPLTGDRGDNATRTA